VERGEDVDGGLQAKGERRDCRREKEVVEREEGCDRQLLAASVSYCYWRGKREED